MLAVEETHLAVRIRTGAGESFPSPRVVLAACPDVPPLLDKRLVLVTGKGGTGKTTVAIALGLAAARAGRRTLVCEVAGQERMSRAFTRSGVGFSETELHDGLFGLSIDPERSLQEYLRQQIGSRPLANLLFHNRVFHYLAAAAPGVRELATLATAWERAQRERFDLVILDAPATGHALGMLRTPRTYGDIARVGPIRRQADKIDSFIHDRGRTGVLVVALPEEMPVNETLEFRDALRAQLHLEVDSVVVNGLYPERFSAADAERIEAVDGEHGDIALATALRAALSEHERARTQRAQLRRLRREVEEVATLPFLFEPELGLDGYERLSRELERRL
jgi:anion-transporting  ArsA/GET3 family ATPase